MPSVGISDCTQLTDTSPAVAAFVFVTVRCVGLSSVYRGVTGFPPGGWGWPAVCYVLFPLVNVLILFRGSLYVNRT